MYRMITAALGEDCTAARGEVPWYLPLSAEGWCRREKALFRELHGQLHATANAETDPGKFADALVVDHEATARSMTLDATTVLMADPTRGMIDNLAKFDAALAKLPGGS
jgi:hypothetical protein